MNDETKNTISLDSKSSTASETRFNLLYEIGLVLSSLETLNEAAPRILEAICRNLQFELGEFWCLGEKENILRLKSVWHLPLPALEKFTAASRQFEFPAGEGLPGKVWVKNAPVWVENLSGEANMPRRFFAEEIGLKSGFAFPLLLGEKFLGAFSFFSRDTRRPDEALLQIFAAIGNSIGQFAKRENTESHLRASEDRYRAFIEQSTEGIWRFELDEKFSVQLPVEEQVTLAFERGYLAECNDAMARMYGLQKAEELIGSRIADMLDMTDAANYEYLRSFIESDYNLIDAESHEKDANGDDKYFLNSLVGTIENGFLVRVWGTQRDITGQKATERAMRVSEENFRAFVQASSQAIWITDAEGQSLEAFGWWENQTGQTRGESAGAGFLNAVHPADRERVGKQWRQAMTNVTSFEVECRIIERAGGFRHFAIRGVPVFNQDESFRQWIGTLTDINDRKLAEQSLTNNEARYRALVEATSTVVWRADPNGELNFVGSVWESVSGQRVEEILGSGWLDALHPDDRERTVLTWENALRTKKIYETEFRVLTVGGEYRWFAVRGVPIFNSDGTVREWVGANSDITERKSAEEAVRESEESYRIVAETASDAIIKIDEESRILFVNSAVERIFGYTVEELSGESLMKLIPQNLREPHRAGFRRYLETGERRLTWESLEIPALRKDGQMFPLEISFGEYDQNGKRFFIGIARDITERKHYEEELRESQATLSLTMRSTRMGAWTREAATRQVWWSEELEEIFGLPPGSFGKSEDHFLELIHHEDRALVRREVERAIIEKRDYIVEFRFHHADGSTRWMEGRGQAFYSTAGEPVRLYGIGIDITERKRAEEKILESEASFRQLAEAVPQFVWVTEIDGSLSYVNEQWLEFSGLTFEQTNDQEIIAQIFHPDDVERLASEWEKSFSTGNILEIELRMRDRRGRYRWFLTRSRPIKDADEKITKWFGTSTDITENKQSESRLTLLAEISELTRAIEVPEELLFAVSSAVGEHLEVRRCLFNEIDLDENLETVHRDYCDGVPSVAGAHRISDYSPITSADMIAGKTVVNSDSKTDARTAENYAKTYEPNGERAYVAVPLLRENRWVASLWVSTDEPREWSRQEVSMLETVAERTWTAIEKLRIDAALRASEQHLQLAVDISRISTFEIDLTTDAVETDAVGRAIYGFEIDEPLTFEKMQARFHPDDKDEVTSRVAAAFAPDGADEFEVEQRIIRTDGETRWIRVRGRAFFETASSDGERRAVRCLGTYVDISSSKRAEEKLRESDAILQTINRNSPTLIYLKDRDGRILTANPATLDVIGKPLAEVVGRTHAEYTGKESEGTIIAENDRQIIEGGKTETFEETVLTAGEPHAFLSTKTPYRNQAGEIIGLVGVSFDITDRKQAEIERERLFAEAEAARQIAEDANHAKDEFIALVSHELRSPLNAMLGWTRILQNQNPDEKTKEYALDVIIRNARSQSRLIEDLLDIARVSRGKLRLEMEPTELIPIINQAIEIIEPAAEAGNIIITQSLDRAADFITGDVDRLRQVIDNLLSNAVKFTAPGGSVEIRLERENSQAKITVSDTGQGISPEFLPQIFERFKQADPSTTRRHGGLGIGLSLARDLVELHGGTISAESAGEDKGSTFIVTLPLRMILPFRETSDKVEFMDSQGKLSGFWILAVDDEADARELVSFMLQINGAKVTTANSAVEALDILKGAEGKLPDILLSDISMPNESGYALLEKVRALPQEHGGQIPAVALTAFNRPEDREAAYEAGFQKHLGKPVEPDDLIQAIIETAGRD